MSEVPVPSTADRAIDRLLTQQDRLLDILLLVWRMMPMRAEQGLEQSHIQHDELLDALRGLRPRTYGITRG